MEYLAIFSIAFLFTIPIIMIFVTQTGNIQADVSRIQAEKAISEIVDSAEEVYFMGEPAQKTIIVKFSKGINEITINEKSIEFNITTTDLNFLLIKDTVANISGTLKTFEGDHVLTLVAQNGQVQISDN